MDRKKVIAWTIIVLLLFFVPAIFIKQFLGLDSWETIPTINFGDITLPGIIVGGIFFWGIILILCAIFNGIKELILFIKKSIKKRTA